MATLNPARSTDYVPPSVREVETTTTVVPQGIRRFSWGAILAGIAVSLVVMIGLNMLGLAIGASTINPSVDPTPIEPALGTGAVIWLAASNLLALFAGGFVTGRLADSPDNFDSIINGLVTWAVVTLITLVFLTSSIGNIINGAASAVSQGISAAGQGAAAISPEIADILNVQASTLQGIGAEVRGLLSNSPDETISGAQNQATTTDANGVASSSPTLTEIELNQSIRQFLTTGTVTDAQRTDLVNLIAERTGVSAADAQATVERWETAYRNLVTQVEETARDVGQKTADAIAALAGSVFVGLLIGAFAAGAGGLIGSPDNRYVAEETVVTRK